MKSKEVSVARLTALWGLSEAGLGGLIHALRIPFTGIVVGSTAIILITLIVYFSERNMRVLLRSMVVVLLIKAAASPHTPIPAYFAVTLQGLMGAFLFSVLPGIRLPAMLLGVAALLEGVVQKFAVMTLLYGKSVWTAIDLIAQKAAGELGIQADIHASLWVIGVYAVYYAGGGLVVGWMAGAIPENIARQLENLDHVPQVPRAETVALPLGNARRWRMRRLLPGLAILAGLVAVYALAPSDAGGVQRSVYILLRTLVILGVWFGLAGPWVRRAINRFLKNRAGRYGHQLAEAMGLMPHLHALAVFAWTETARYNRFVRWYRFVALLVTLSLVVDPDQMPFKD
ncbi:MAG: hypothetical protein PHP44_06910 [Kiritimatiellae bacterium]|nr:hypothetical protein [Kiritimatiellia bacterium]MDD4735818.1 hypothetical protein [Kiritimatiellia bacterium]